MCEIVKSARTVVYHGAIDQIIAVLDGIEGDGIKACRPGSKTVEREIKRYERIIMH